MSPTTFKGSALIWTANWIEYEWSSSLSSEHLVSLQCCNELNAAFNLENTDVLPFLRLNCLREHFSLLPSLCCTLWSLVFDLLFSLGLEPLFLSDIQAFSPPKWYYSWACDIPSSHFLCLWRPRWYHMFGNAALFKASIKFSGNWKSITCHFVNCSICNGHYSSLDSKFFNYCGSEMINVCTPRSRHQSKWPITKSPFPGKR